MYLHMYNQRKFGNHEEKQKLMKTTMEATNENQQKIMYECI